MDQIDLNSIIGWDIPGEVIVSLGVMLIVIILSFVVFLLARKADPLKPSKGLLNVLEIAVEKVDRMVLDAMGPAFKNFGGYYMGIAAYIFLCFIVGIAGFPAPLTGLEAPLSLGLLGLCGIHGVAIKYQKGRYFKRFIDPIPIFLPMNLLSMWVPMISLTFRLFGNALSGWVIMSLLYNAFTAISQTIFGSQYGSILFSSVAGPILHAYFDVIVGLLQTYVYMMVTALLIVQEKPDEEDDKVLDGVNLVPPKQERRVITNE